MFLDSPRSSSRHGRACASVAFRAPTRLAVRRAGVESRRRRVVKPLPRHTDSLELYTKHDTTRHSDMKYCVLMQHICCIGSP
jgi:hypothetical protein